LSINLGWHPNRAIFIEQGCKNKTSKYCEIYHPKHRDYYWLYAEHAEQHKQKVLDELKHRTYTEQSYN
jgi:uncharacterized protein YcgL (UPF0745 family)